MGDSEGFRRAALFDDEISLVHLDDLLNLRQLVARKHRETRRVCADSFIFIEGERDRVEAGGSPHSQIQSPIGTILEKCSFKDSIRSFTSRNRA